MIDNRIDGAGIHGVGSELGVFLVFSKTKGAPPPKTILVGEINPSSSRAVGVVGKGHSKLGVVGIMPGRLRHFLIIIGIGVKFQLSLLGQTLAVLVAARVRRILVGKGDDLSDTQGMIGDRSKILISPPENPSN